MLTDFIVIGSGLSGLISSLILKEEGQVLLISKSRLSDCATNLAQGGIAAVVGKNDSFGSHIKDTLIAGGYHNKKKAVEEVVKNGPSAINWLVKQGVIFDRKNNDLSLTKEAAHSFPRVVHAKDFTGREIEKVLVEKVKSEKNILIWEDCLAVKLLVKKRVCYGVQVIKNGKVTNCFGRATVLATGGLGQNYLRTTNPKIATGDGIAMAASAGAKLSDLEFIQFHPTALKNGSSPLFLLSESLRGEGACLVNNKGERFMKKIDKRAELAPRDIVARAIFRQQKKSEVYLDIRHRGSSYVKARFPNITHELKKRGFDLGADLIPVTPAAHYSCGGVSVDLYGRTTIKNLFAFGEVASTGVHGANRLASNSLLEAVVFPLKLKSVIPSLPKKISRSYFPSPKLKKTSLKIFDLQKKLKRLMWEKVGILRTKKGLKEAYLQLKKWEQQLKKITVFDRDFIEIKNMVKVSSLITKAAIKRKKSLGTHYIE